MTLSATTYIEHLRAYVNGEYVVHDGNDGKVVLTEKYFQEGDLKPKIRKIELLLPGAGLAFKLDQEECDLGKGKKKGKPALFHFLDDNAKPWSKRCDFVVFYVHGRKFCADCIEFKSKNLDHSKILPQLKAGENWVNALKRTIQQYTGDAQRIRIRKFVFGENDNPGAYLTPNRQLNADPSVRYYHFDEVNGQSLAALQNASVQEI